jgi:tetratricopeptide (TPR) repeat protein
MDRREAPTVPTEVGQGECLSIEELVAMVEGRITADHADRAIAHIDSCADCAEVIANLGRLDGPARRIDRYQVERVLGTGGMGIVYAAFDPELQRRLAIKLVRPDASNEKFQPMMLEEARTLARLSHPNVVGVYDVGEHDGELFVATELVDGMTLSDWQVGKSVEQIVDAWIQVARGLAAAHEVGVVHRDVKPSNIFVGRDGRIRVGDFGIAYAGAPADVTSSEQTAVVAGTPAYMAPEQKSGRVDARSDQFATCVAIAEALTGVRPSSDAHVVLPNEALAAALSRGLHFQPAQRFPTMLALVDALELAIRPPPKKSRKPFIFITGGASIALVAVIVLATRSTVKECTLSADRVWSRARAENIAALPAFNVTPAIERWVKRWSAAAGEVCADPDAARTRCLGNALDALDRVLAGWEVAAPRSSMTMYVALEELPHVEACSRAAVAAAGDPTEREAARELAAKQSRNDPRLAAQTLRAALAKSPDDFTKVHLTIDLMGLLGTDQLTELEALAASTKKLIAALGGDPALTAEVDMRVGMALNGTDRTAAAIAALEHARTGMTLVHGEGSPQEASVLVALSGAYYRRDGVTSHEARAAGKRADELWANHRIKMPSTVMPATPVELIAQLEEAQAASREMNGGSVEMDFDTAYALTSAYMLAGDAARALEHGLLAIELADKVVKQTARSSSIRAHVATLLVEAGRANDALPHARDAVAIAQKLAAGTELATARGILGRVLVDVGQNAEAREPLQSALAHLTTTNAIARHRGTTRFTLARALWDTDRARAIDQARVARAELDSALGTPELDVAANPVGGPYIRDYVQQSIVAIDRWLAAHAK